MSGTGTSRLRVVIVDDEPPARRRIRGFLLRHSDADVIGEAGAAGSAIALIRNASPDVVLLDVRLPDASGFEVLERADLDRVPAIIFVTAYGEFALRAFEVQAVDYLLKPFDEQRFAAAMERARSYLRRDPAEPTDPHSSAWHGPAPRYAERIVLKVGGRLRMLPVSEIDYLEAQGNLVRVHSGAGSYPIRATLAGLEASLDPKVFLRLRRSFIVRIDRIGELEPLFHGEYVIRLRDGTKLISGRTYRERLQRRLGIA